MKEHSQRFTFTPQMMEAVKLITTKDTLTPNVLPEPEKQAIQIEGNLRPISSKIARLFESRDFLIFALANFENKLGSILTIYYFSKAKGQNQCKQIPTIKGRVTAMQFVEPTQGETITMQKAPEGLLLLLGNTEGFMKILDFGAKPQLTSLQIDTKPLIDIRVPPTSKFSNTKICFVLAQDYSVYIVNIQVQAVIAHFRPTIMMCDSGLSLSLHSSMKYFIEATKGGYIVFWKINDNIFKTLEKQRQKKMKKIFDNNKMADENQDKQQFKTKKERPPQRIYNVFPSTIIHSASIQGLKFAQFMGDLIAIITGDGIFKIIALNIEQKQQFATILQYKIQSGDTVTDAKILSKQECLVISRRQKNNYGCLIQCIFFSPELIVTKVLTVKLVGMSMIQNFILNKNKKFLFVRNQGKFFINYTSALEDKIQDNYRQNKSYRSLNY